MHQDTPPPTHDRLTAFRFWLEGRMLRMAIDLFRLLPVDIASAVMGFFWRKIAPLTPRHKRALGHLEFAFPDMSDQERQQILRGMWDNLGRVAAETFHIDRLLAQDCRFETDTDALTNQVLAGERACLFVSLHTANWELCVQPAVRKGIEITGIYQALRNPAADQALRDLRKDLYKGGLLSKGHRTARRLVATIRSGGVVALMGDLRETRGIKVTFFGRPAYANPVPATLARSYGVPIVLGRVVRKNGVTFRIEGRALEVATTDDRAADIHAATAEMHRVFEGWIREYPDQWMWIHKKWAPPRKSAARKQAQRASSAS